MNLINIVLKTTDIIRIPGTIFIDPCPPSLLHNSQSVGKHGAINIGQALADKLQ